MTIATILSLATIIVLPVGLWGLPIDCNNYWGAYNIQNKVIYICGGMTTEETTFVKYHELAHYFWFNYLNNTQRNKYTILYMNATEFTRPYSKTSVVEDFADNFALLTMGWSTNANINKRINKIKYYIRITKWK